ncbi:hypothetical protein [Candidatus Palauibacter sp.]|uniref:hypothetical protein n=1 Tax=Candidatus Palauibacter sp. TaxID=3101350 RepID=UPI003B52A99D
MSRGFQRFSNDNPYSEARFKTPPGPPGPVRRHRGGEGTSAAPSSHGYNTEHRHGGIGPLTPRQVHLGRVPEVIAPRRKVLAAAYAARPDRFVGWPAELPDEVWINRALPITSANAAGPAAAGETEGSLN